MNKATEQRSDMDIVPLFVAPSGIGPVEKPQSFDEGI